LTTKPSSPECRCAVCASSTSVALGYGQQYGTLAARWGYGAQHDGERYHVVLCETCFFQVLAFLRQERRINNLFADIDDEVFGPTARDDFWRET
jgi:hypothetical protein